MSPNTSLGPGTRNATATAPVRRSEQAMIDARAYRAGSSLAPIRVHRTRALTRRDDVPLDILHPLHTRTARTQSTTRKSPAPLVETAIRSYNFGRHLPDRLDRVPRRDILTSSSSSSSRRFVSIRRTRPSAPPSSVSRSSTRESSGVKSSRNGLGRNLPKTQSGNDNIIPASTSRRCRAS